jgi:hypothetical protein
MRENLRELKENLKTQNPTLKIAIREEAKPVRLCNNCRYSNNSLSHNFNLCNKDYSW